MTSSSHFLRASSRARSCALSQFARSSIFLTFVLLIVLFDAAASPSGRVAITGSDIDDFFTDNAKSISTEINELHQREPEDPRDAETVVETVCHDFRYPVKTKLELTGPRGTARFRRSGGPWTSKENRSSAPVRKAGEKEVANFVHEMLSVLEEVESNRELGFYTGWIEQDTRINATTKKTTSRENAAMVRFRRNDKSSVTQTSNSSKDYMSTYYAQRKAIMDKYKSQQREIMERLKKTKNLIAETRKLKESRKIDLGKSDASQNELPDAPSSNVTDYTDAPSATISSVDFSPTITSTPSPKVTVSNSMIVTNTQKPSLNNSEALFDSSDYEAADYSTEVDPPNSTLPLANETLRPIVNHKTDIVDKPDVEALERDWRSEAVNLIPQNEVDSNLTEQNSIGVDNDNDTVIFNLGGQLVNPSSRNDSALDQLEKMFLWEVPVGSERIPRFDNDSQARVVNAIPETDRSENSSQSTDSLRFMVEIKSSPEVQVTKNIKNVRTSTTTYRNSTHEIVEVDGVVNSTKRINATDSLDVDSPYWKNTNFTDSSVASAPGPEVGGGARESEWCEECQHDYRWGNCEGTLFYQHNIFLRNRGPSAIDAIFGMNVQGPVSITCVEAIRFNQTRGIVSLHSGGQGHDFAKLRIRGFQGEGFSYILKVWGVANEEDVEN